MAGPHRFATTSDAAAHPQEPIPRSGLTALILQLAAVKAHAPMATFFLMQVKELSASNLFI
jgi:hypothetical protein